MLRQAIELCHQPHRHKRLSTHLSPAPAAATSHARPAADLESHLGAACAYKLHESRPSGQLREGLGGGGSGGGSNSGRGSKRGIGGNRVVQAASAPLMKRAKHVSAYKAQQVSHLGPTCLSEPLYTHCSQI